MSRVPRDSQLGWEDLIYVADFLQDAGQSQITLLGGEPALHSQFVELAVYLIERRFSVRVFTSGLWPEPAFERAVEFFHAIPPERLAFICNLNNPRQTPGAGAEWPRVSRFLEEFGPRTTPGFNIYRPDFELDFLFQAVNQFGMQRHLRLGLANPIPEGGNAFIDPDAIGVVIRRLFDHAEAFERLRIRPGLDCGFPLCRFADAELAWLFKHGGPPKFTCGPALDIGPNLEVWSCFPLSSFHKRSLYEFDHLSQLNEFFEDRLREVRRELGGIYPACDSCDWRRAGLCAGGCAAMNFQALHRAGRLPTTDVPCPI